MTNLVTLSGDIAVTSTLTVAKNTDNEHASVIVLVRKYLADLQDFGQVDLKSTRPERGGHPIEYAELNEQQATLLLTYMRNSPIVRAFKKSLVRAFFDMAQRIKMRASDPMAVLNDPTAMRGLLLTY
ncbi:MAG: Rha family transcriptional regulator, partial [Burkholderiales bacterium]